MSFNTNSNPVTVFQFLQLCENYITHVNIYYGSIHEKYELSKEPIPISDCLSKFADAKIGWRIDYIDAKIKCFWIRDTTLYLELYVFS